MRKLLLFVLLSSLVALAQQPTNTAAVGGTTTPVGNGSTAGGGVQRVVIANDQTAYAVKLGDGTNTVTLNSTTTSGKFGADVNILSILGTAPTTAGKLDVKGADGDVFVRQTTAANLNATVRLQDGSGNAISSSAGALNVAVTALSLSTTASANGSTTLHKVAAANDNASSVKGSAGQVYAVDVYNNAAYPIYAKLYNSASSPTGCGATNLLRTIGVQAGTRGNISEANGIVFSSGIGLCIVKGLADADDTSVAASDAVVDISYK